MLFSPSSSFPHLVSSFSSSQIFDENCQRKIMLNRTHAVRRILVPTSLSVLDTLSSSLQTITLHKNFTMIFSVGTRFNEHNWLPYEALCGWLRERHARFFDRKQTEPTELLWEMRSVLSVSERFKRGEILGRNFLLEVC